MNPKLNYDCFQNILEFLESDQCMLFKCLLVNRSWFEISVPFLWKNPFSSIHNVTGIENPRMLLKTIISMFPFEKNIEDKLNSCKDFKVTYHKHGQPLCNYLSFMKIFKSVEFHGFIDKCSRAPYYIRRLEYENDEGTISSILSYHIYDIIYKNCTQIKQIMLLTISKRILKMKSFDNLSNLCELEIGEVRYLEKIINVCKQIKKIVINIHDEFNNHPLLINFLKVQSELKVVYLLSHFQLFQFPNELFIQMYSNEKIEELSIKNLMLPHLPLQQINISSKLKRLEITVPEWTSQANATFLNVSCPLLEVLKFHDNHPPLKVLAEFIEKTEGHLQCFYLKYSSEYVDTQILLKSIAKSCLKIKSLTAVIDTTKDLSFLEHLIISCNELENLTLISDDNLRLFLLQERLRKIDNYWNISNDFKASDYSGKIKFSKYKYF